MFWQLVTVQLVPFRGPPDQVGQQVGAQVADVRGAVHGRPAAVDAQAAPAGWLDRLNLPGPGVIEPQHAPSLWVRRGQGRSPRTRSAGTTRTGKGRVASQGLSPGTCPASVYSADRSSVEQRCRDAAHRSGRAPRRRGEHPHAGRAGLSSTSARASVAAWCTQPGAGLTSSVPSISSYRRPSSGISSRSLTVKGWATSPGLATTVMVPSFLPAGNDPGGLRQFGQPAHRGVDALVGGGERDPDVLARRPGRRTRPGRPGCPPRPAAGPRPSRPGRAGTPTGTGPPRSARSAQPAAWNAGSSRSRRAAYTARCRSACASSSSAAAIAAWTGAGIIIPACLRISSSRAMSAGSPVTNPAR